MRLSDIALIEGGKRPEYVDVHISDRATVPVIGASKIIGYTEKFMFHDKVLVVGRVGTHGVVQRHFRRIWPSDNTLTIRTDYFEFVYQVLKSIDYSILNCGSTQPLITQGDLKNVEIWVPKESKLLEYEHKVKPITNLIKNNLDENNILGLIRDNLLPMLVSGESTHGFKSYS